MRPDRSSNFNRLVEVVLPRGGFLVPVVEAYFDESGSHHGAPVLCMAGYIIGRGQAKLLTKEWSAVLKAKSLTHFHMTDCAHGNGEFANLSKIERVEVARKLIEIIKMRTLAGRGATIVDAEYSSLMPYHPNLGSAYNLLLWCSLFGVKQWANETSFSGNVAYFFEAGHRSQSEANRILNLSFRNVDTQNELYYISHTFINKAVSPVIQAADLFAWQLYTERRHILEGRPRRKDFENLVSNGRHVAMHIGPDRIQELIELMASQDAWNRF